MSIVVLTYNCPHRKTYDTLCALKARGYDDVVVFGQPMTYTKKRQPLIAHRPDLISYIPNPRDLCSNLGYVYVEGEISVSMQDKYDDSLFLVCGAGILPSEFVKTHRIINAHPGYIPLARGLDAYKWSIWNDLPLGVTTHFLGEYVDAGEIIERRTIDIFPYDTFHSVANRIYENEIDMLVGAIDKIGEKHEIMLPAEDSFIFKRMPESIERQLFERFEVYKTNRMSKGN